MPDLASRWRALAELIESLVESFRTRKKLFLVLYSILYWAGTCGIALNRTLWYDELFTFYLAKLPLSVIGTAFAQGADTNPPVFFVLTHIAQQMFGDGEVATRLTSIFAFWIMSLCLFAF